MLDIVLDEALNCARVEAALADILIVFLCDPIKFFNTFLLGLPLCFILQAFQALDAISSR